MRTGPARSTARRAFLAGAAAFTATACAGEATSLERRLIDMPADSWLEMPGTKLADVCAPKSFGVAGRMGCAGIVEAWGGGAYARGPRTMFVWGGGHDDYWGNEVYAFELRRGRWQRLTDPTPGKLVAESGSDPLPDGRPNSRHTYDGLQFIESAGKLFAQGGAISPGGGKSAITWLFDASAGTWEHAGDQGRPSDYGLASAWDPADKAVIVRATKGLWRYKTADDSWTRLADFGARPHWPRYEVSGNKRGAIDTRRRLFWSVGSRDFLVWDLANEKVVTDEWVTSGAGEYSNEARVKRYPDQVFRSGGGEIFDASAPGFDYDTKADQFVAWKGGAPYILDLATKTWKTGNAAGAPTAQAKNGTFGRWRYVPEYNVFILVNGAGSNVYFYKNKGGGP